MARILISSGPTREYLDPVRYLTNGSSGRMGSALARQAVLRGHDVVVVTGPVSIEYPPPATIIRVVSTFEMLDACVEHFKDCDGVIAAAAPCDFRPKSGEAQKISKSGEELSLELVETPDIVARLGAMKRPGQWALAFALETQDGYRRALDKLRRKNCDLIVLNDPSAIDAAATQVQIIDPAGITMTVQGTKDDIASSIFDRLDREFLSAENPRLR